MTPPLTEMDKMTAETRNILRETVVIPFLAGAACMAALGGVAGAIALVIVKIIV